MEWIYGILFPQGNKIHTYSTFVSKTPWYVHVRTYFETQTEGFWFTSLSKCWRWSWREVRHVIMEELAAGPDRLNGYRTMWHILRLRHHMHVQRQLVASMHIARYWSWWCAAQKTQTRLHQRTHIRPGPNLSWHVDGYDKLKPFGLSVHGCIDGFSRRLLWLQVQRSNKNPRVIANCFLEYVNATLGCPVLPLTNIEALKRALLQRCNVIFGGKLLRWIFWDKSSPVSIQSMKSENRILLVFISKDAF